jgi:hypothetical protein
MPLVQKTLGNVFARVSKSPGDGMDLLVCHVTGFNSL